MSSELVWEKRQFGHRARLALTPVQVRLMDDQAHAARATWNLVHNLWTMTPKCQRSPSRTDAVIRQARKEIDWLGVLPAQAAQAVLKTYFQAWKNCWDGRAEEPAFKARVRSVMSVDIPQGRDLQIKRVHRRWGMVNLPKAGRVRFRWTKDLPVGNAGKDNRITGARLVKDALGWHIAFRVTALEPVREPHTGPEVGIDLGVNMPLALSDGNHQEHGRPVRGEDGKSDRDRWLNTDEKAKPLRLEQRAAHRKSFRKPKERSSNRLRNTYDQIKQLRATATRRATDWQQCAVWRSVVSPNHSGRTWKEVLGTPNLPETERPRGQEHVGKAVSVWRRSIALCRKSRAIRPRLDCQKSNSQADNSRSHRNNACSPMTLHGAIMCCDRVNFHGVSHRSMRVGKGMSGRPKLR